MQPVSATNDTHRMQQSSVFTGNRAVAFEGSTIQQFNQSG
jgi:hypothetical protein